MGGRGMTIARRSAPGTVKVAICGEIEVRTI